MVGVINWVVSYIIVVGNNGDVVVDGGVDGGVGGGIVPIGESAEVVDGGTLAFVVFAVFIGSDLPVAIEVGVDVVEFHIAVDVD